MVAVTPLGRLIQDKRKELGYTLSDLSERTGIMIQTISAIERGGSKRPRFETLYALALSLELSMDELAAAAYPVSSPPPSLKEPALAR